MKLALLALIAITVPLAANASEVSAAKKRHYTHVQEHHFRYRASGPAAPTRTRFGTILQSCEKEEFFLLRAASPLFASDPKRTCKCVAASTFTPMA